ncbi:DUF4142 domain-containing protein [Brevundimonas basaltis]|uniref:DUF4142 domain-containing protein n=1 Tax=Brevundimonas basaltis TaxID=472166 RepID=UPI001FEBFD50|nr:DUF4142 domain-containing protein [Brevundimonas basaltis]
MCRTERRGRATGDDDQDGSHRRLQQVQGHHRHHEPANDAARRTRRAPPRSDQQSTRGGRRRLDRVFLDQQIAARSEALTLHRGLSDHNEAPPLAEHARSVVPKIEGHLRMAEQLKASNAG